MKKLIFILILLTLTIKSTSQNCLTGQFILNDNGNTQAQSVTITDDGGYIIAGYTTVSGEGQEDLFVTKIDSLNNIEWSNTYGTSSIEKGYPIDITKSLNGYLVSLQSTAYATSIGGLIILELNPLGQIIWQKKVNNSSGFSDSRVVYVDDFGNNLIAGTVNYNTAGGNDAYLMKMDNLGNVVWSTTFGTNSHDHAISVIKTEDDGYFYVGQNQHFGIGLSSKLLIKVNSIGTYQWSKYYDNDDNETFKKIRKTNNGNYLIVGIEGSPGSYKTNLTKIDSLGNLIWSKNYFGPNNDFGSDIEIVQSGLIYISGISNSFGNGGNEIFLSKLDASGNEIWTNFYGGISDELMHGNANLLEINEAEEKIFLTANTSSFGGTDNDPYIVITDLDGNSDCNSVSANWTVTNETPTIGIAPGTIGSMGTMSNSNLIMNPFNTTIDTLCFALDSIIDSVNLCPSNIIDTTICRNDSIQVNLDIGTNYIWSPNYNISNINSQNPILYPVENTTYIASYIKDSCNAFDTIHVNIENISNLITNPSIYLTYGDSTFIDVSGSINYTWTPTEGLSCSDCENPVVTATQNMVYYVSSIVNGCKTIDSVEIIVNQIEDCIVMPNAFSPNNDLVNDELYPISILNNVEIKTFRIYNRWGEEIHNGNKAWDGNYKGKEQPIDVYIYFVEYECNNEIKKIVGNISLIR